MSDFEITKKQEFDASILTLRSDGILNIHMKANKILKQSDGEDIVKGLAEMGNGKKFLLLFTAGEDTSVSTEARYYASTPEANKFTIASAFVVKSIAQKLLGNAYVTFNKPITPTRIFTDESDAVRWLNTFR
ncbi:MAG: hypothetical protein K0S44_2789 [Bacteroidetes bacterium]|jgi:hypothetical protein|nr:hypothetical protein [Bacteroidota bacterium]